MTAARGAAHYPIRAVSRMTGLSVDTLRAWERRYEAVTPKRDERGRVYSADDVTRLKMLALLLEEGHAIGRIAGLSNAALAKLRRQSAGAVPAVAASTIDLIPLRTSLKQYDIPAIEAILNRHAVMLPPAELIFSVVLPILRDLGERWEAGNVRPAQEHLVSAAIRSVLGGLLRTLPRAPGARKIVLATTAGERHELGLLSAAVLAAGTGAHVVYLGPDLPSEDIAHATAVSAADILLIASTTSEGTGQEDVSKLARVPARVQIWAGGPRAAELRRVLGTRVRILDRLEDVAELLERHVA